ncbi:MAG: hypothetical protein J6I55_06065 [Ruminococcus sp.]|nr:hypothetical protein [Ruminococcus sp.]HAE53212.1 hypothetical protein [Ruminococcus sp.]
MEEKNIEMNANQVEFSEYLKYGLLFCIPFVGIFMAINVKRCHPNQNIRNFAYAQIILSIVMSTMAAVMKMAQPMIMDLIQK